MPGPPSRLKRIAPPLFRRGGLQPALFGLARAISKIRRPSPSRQLLDLALLLALLLPALALPARATAQSNVTETPLCTILKDPLAYDHKYVKVRGTIRLMFEDFTIHSPDCATHPEIWLMFAGDVATPTTSTWGDTQRPPGQNLVFAGSSFALAKDDNFWKFFSLITARADKNPIYRVTATITGGFFAAGAKMLMSGGNKLTSAYGHLNCCNLLLITSVSDVESDPPAPAALDGQVVSEAGAPLSGVTVINKTPTPQPQVRTATTDADGRFHFAYPGQILQFRKEDSRPLTELLGPGADSTLIVLHDSKLTDWTITACTAAQLSQKRIGSDLLFDIPSGAKSRKEGKRAPLTYFISYGGDTEGLRLSFDSQVQNAEPPADWLLSVSTDERWIKDPAGKVIGLDSQGLWANNTRWRFTVFRNEAVAQYSASGPNATFYNEVITSACDSRAVPPKSP